MRISRKYPVAFLLTTMGTSIAIFFALSEVLRVSIEREIVKRGQAAAESFASANGPQMLRLTSGDERSRLQFAVLALASDRDVLAARVADHLGVIIASLDKAEQGQRLPAPFAAADAPSVQIELAQHAYHFRAPMRYGGVDIGTFVLSLSRAPLEQALKSARRQAVLFTAAIAAAMSLFVLLFVRREMRRLGAISSTLDAVAKGDFSVRLSVAGRDEISELSQAFNHMAARAELFFHYVDKIRIERLIADESLTKPGGREHDLAVIFGDMRGYTSMSNRKSPDQVVRVVNAYFHLFIECVAHAGGVVDKTMGDGIMIVFERQGRDGDHGHQKRAALAVAYMKAAARVLAAFLRQRLQSGEVLAIEPREFGFAVAAGKAIVGNIGSWRRMDYTVCGRVVNLASRLEGLTRQGEVILDNYCRNAAEQLLVTEALPPVQPKGYSEHEKVTPHRLVALTPDETHRLRVFLKRVFTYTFIRDHLLPERLPAGEHAPWCQAAELALLKLLAELPSEVLFRRVDIETGEAIDVSPAA